MAIPNMNFNFINVSAADYNDPSQAFLEAQTTAAIETLDRVSKQGLRRSRKSQKYQPDVKHALNRSQSACKVVEAYRE